MAALTLAVIWFSWPRVNTKVLSFDEAEKAGVKFEKPAAEKIESIPAKLVLQFENTPIHPTVVYQENIYSWYCYWFVFSVKEPSGISRRTAACVIFIVYDEHINTKQVVARIRGHGDDIVDVRHENGRSVVVAPLEPPLGKVLTIDILPL